MLKKGIAAAALIAATSSVYAGGVEVAPAYIGGAYVDVGLSRDDVYDNFQRNLTLTSDSGEGSVERRFRTIDAGARGWDGFVGVGWTQVWDNEWTLGIEAFGDVSSARGTQFSQSAINLISAATSNNVSSYLQAKRTYGVSLMPGYFLAPGSLYFFEVGYVNTEFDLSSSPTPFNVGDTSNYIANSGALPSIERDRNGLRLGWGTNTQVGPHLAIRQEYVWETYGSFSVSRYLANTDEDDITSTVTQYARVRPNMSKYNLAAVYYFARQGNAPDLNSAPAHVGGSGYVGLNGSYDEDYAHSTFVTVGRVTTETSGAISENTATENAGLMKITGWNIGLFTGGGYTFSNRWYAGAEVFANYDDVTGRYNLYHPGTRTTAGALVANTTISDTSRLSKNWDFGVAFIPGYQVSDFALLYARIGYVGADFSIKNNWTGANEATVDLSNERNRAMTGTNSRWLGGLQLGVGVDTRVYENVSLRSEFNINNFGNYAVNNRVRSEDVQGATRITTISTRHRHIIEDQFNVALIWHFFS